MQHAARRDVPEWETDADAAAAAELLNDKASSPPPRNTRALSECKVNAHMHAAGAGIHTALTSLGHKPPAFY